MRFREFLKGDFSLSEAKVSNTEKIIPKDLNDLQRILNLKRTKLANIEIPKHITSLRNLFNPRFVKLERTDFSGLETWDVSHITDMSGMFVKCKNFTGKEIEHWNVKNVKNFSEMFGGCPNFNADLSRWNVSNAEKMLSMFSGCENFTGKGLEKWDVSNVTGMYHIFYNCKKITGKSIEKWNLDSLRDESAINIKRIIEGSGVENNIPKNFMELIKKAEERSKENEREKEKKLADAFKETFGVDYSKAPKKAQELWKGYDRFAAYIDDGREYKKAMDNNEWIYNEIKKLLKNN